MTGATNRLWLSAILAWLAMVATIVGAARAGWLGGGPASDREIHTWSEFLLIVVVATSVPLLLISVGVFLPLMWVFRRLGGWRPSRLVNGAVGIALVLPALAVIAVASKLIGWHMRGPIPLAGIMILVIGGLVFGLTTPSQAISDDR